MDLIERLIDEADGYGDGPVVVHDIEGLRALLREASAALEAAHADIDGMRETIMAEHDARIESEAALEAAREDAERLDSLRLANEVTKALFPELYGKPGLTTDQVALLMGSRGIIHDVLRAALDHARGKGGAGK